jgi:hypothetical protein
MIDLDQFRDYVIEPTLEDLGMLSTSAVELVLGTALQESHLTYIKQLGEGPALGVCQMEPNTHDDIWENFLKYRNVLSDAVLDIGGPNAPELIWNLKYSVAMCRVHYRRVRSPLPQAGDVAGQAQYWKTYYNTELGKGTTQEYIDNWSRTHG